MRAVIFPRPNLAGTRGGIKLLLLLRLLSPLFAQQYFDQYYNYSIWPPFSWAQQLIAAGDVMRWASPEGELKLQVDLLDRARFHDLDQLQNQTLHDGDLRHSSVKMRGQQPPPGWLQPMLALREQLRQPYGEGQILSYRKKSGEQGWLLLWQAPQWYYRVSASGPPLLSAEQAAVLLSILDTFAPTEQGLWYAGAVSTVYQQQLLHKELGQILLPFNGKQASWKSSHWKAIRETAEGLIARELLLLGQDRLNPVLQNYAIERYYQLVFRSNFQPFSKLPRLFARRAAVLPVPSPGISGEQTAPTGQNTSPPLPQQKKEASPLPDRPGGKVKTGQNLAEQDSTFSYLFDSSAPLAKQEELIFPWATTESAQEQEQAENKLTMEDEPHKDATVKNEGEEGKALQEMPLLPLSINRPTFAAGTATGKPQDAGDGDSEGGSMHGRRTPLPANLNEKVSPEHALLVQLLYTLQDKSPQKQVDFPPQFQAPLANFWQQSPDLDTLLLASSILLSHLGFHTLVLYSQQDNYSLLGIETPGPGARVRWFSRSYLLFDLGKRVKAGWVPRQTTDLQHWQAVSFPAYLPPRP